MVLSFVDEIGSEFKDQRPQRKIRCSRFTVPDSSNRSVSPVNRSTEESKSEVSVGGPSVSSGFGRRVALTRNEQNKKGKCWS